MFPQKYIQCKMEKNGAYQTAWIPSRYAVEDSVIRLKDDNGWYVVEVYPNQVMTEKQIKEQNERVHSGIFGSIKDQ